MKKLLLIILSLSLVGVVSYKFFSTEEVEKVDKPNLPAEVVEKVKKVERPEVKLTQLEFEMPAEEDLDDLTKTLVGLTGEDVLERNRKVFELRNRALKKMDFQAIYTFLKQEPKEEGSNLRLHSLKNDLLVFVIDDGRYKESTAKLMLEIVNDPYQHEVMKEYTFQYFTDYFEKNWLSGGLVKSEKSELTDVEKALQNKMISTLWNALEEEAGPIPGTALIKLNDISKRFSVVDTVKLEKATEEMIKNSNMPNASRMAALSIAAERNMHELAQVAQEIALSKDVGISLKMSALHTASVMKPDEEFQKQIKEEFIENEQAHRLLKRAALKALKKINSGRG